MGLVGVVCKALVDIVICYSDDDAFAISRSSSTKHTLTNFQRRPCFSEGVSM
jgi:hypothetical protein